MVDQVSLRAAIVARTMSFFLPIALICIGAAIVVFKFQMTTVMTEFKSSDRASIQVGTNAIKNTVDLVARDLVFLAQHHGFNDLLSNSNWAANDHAGFEVKSDWIALSRAAGKYDQIRWLDESGQEQVRVNFNSGRPAAVTDDRLQNKAMRYYFKDTLKLNTGEIFISPLDLNMEEGHLEIPIKPMIRIGTPVFSRDGEPRGVLLVNYLGQNMLNEFEQVLGEEKERAWLLNRDGFWLKGSTLDQEWGFMKDLPEATLKKKHNVAWQEILQSSSGQFENEEGLWTFSTIYPLKTGQETSAGNLEAFKPSLSFLQTNQYFWKAVLLKPRAEIEAVREDIVHKISIIVSLFLLGTLIGCWRLAVAWARDLEKEEKLRRINAGLEQTVAERTRELEERSERFRSITTTASAAIIITVDQDGNVVTWNPAAERAFGYSEQEALGMSMAKFMPDGYRKAHERGLARSAKAEHIKFQKTINDVEGLHKNGRIFPLELSLGTWKQNGVRYFSAVMMDITERKEQEEKLKHLATHDLLTGLPTRILCREHLNRSMAWAKRNQGKVAVMFIDLDGFKQVNDTLGHAKGDDLLIEAAKRLRRCIREADIVARIGGDEFMVILVDVSDADAVAEVAQKIIGALNKPFALSTQQMAEIGACVGISLYPEHGTSEEVLINKADKAMYKVKVAGKNGFAFAEVETAQKEAICL